MSEKKIIYLRNAVSTLLASIKVSVTNIYGAARALVIALVLMSSTGYFLLSAWKFLNVTDDQGLAHAGDLYGLAVVGALCIVAGVTKLATGSFVGVGRLGLPSALFAGVFMLLVNWATVRYMVHLSPHDIELWKSIMPAGLPRMASWILIMTASFVALDLILRPDYDGLLKVLESDLRNIGVLMACGVCAYAVVLIFAPGYVLSAYLARWAIFPSFLFILAFAIATYIYFMAACTVISNGRGVQSKSLPATKDLANRTV